MTECSCRDLAPTGINPFLILVDKLIYLRCFYGCDEGSCYLGCCICSCGLLS
jgi:hypothetical protein